VAIFVLVAAAVGLAMMGGVGALGPSLLAVVLLPLVIALLAGELDREGGRVAVRIVDFASRMLPKHSRADHRDEWRDHVLASGEVGVRPGLSAIAIALIAAPRLAVAEHLGEYGGFSFLGRLGPAIKAALNVKPFPPIRRPEHLARIDLMRVSDQELVEIRCAVRRARRRNKPIPLSLIRELASIQMSHRLHSLRGCKQRRRPIHIRMIGGAKFYAYLLRSNVVSTSDTQAER
jgi:hypothetical protein